MKAEKDEITLGGKKHPVKALTLDRLQEVISALEALSARGTSVGTQFIHGRRVVAAGLDMSDEELAKIESVTVAEVLDAIPVIMRVSGMDELKNRRAAATKK